MSGVGSGVLIGSWYKSVGLKEILGMSAGLVAPIDESIGLSAIGLLTGSSKPNSLPE
jgi:hypothetical protein